MGVQAVYIDLPEDRGFVVDNIFALRPQTGALNLVRNDSSVPGSKQTATLMSSGAEKPPVPELKRRVNSLSPILAGRVLTF